MVEDIQMTQERPKLGVEGPVLPRLAAAEPLNWEVWLSHRGKGGSVDKHWVHRAQEDQYHCTHSQL